MGGVSRVGKSDYNNLDNHGYGAAPRDACTVAHAQNAHFFDCLLCEFEVACCHGIVALLPSTVGHLEIKLSEFPGELCSQYRQTALTTIHLH